MKFYLVGGAVRDQVLGLDPQDMDYVAIGATESDMLRYNLRRIAAQNFPVFQDEDGNEYALARRERKTGGGYHGFEVDFGPEVTLEEDLGRRDLTINAMARDMDDDSLVDPFNGQADLANGILRHVTSAFREDPVRVLRVARFAARYNFTVADETLKLMKNIVQAGELDNLTKERVWKEVSKALQEPYPGQFVEVLGDCGALVKLFPDLYESHPMWIYPKYIHSCSMLGSYSQLESRMTLLAPWEKWEEYKAPSKIVRTVRKLQCFSEEIASSHPVFTWERLSKYGLEERFLTCARELYGPKPIDAMVDIAWVLDIQFRDMPQDLQEVEPRLRGKVLYTYRKMVLLKERGLSGNFCPGHVPPELFKKYFPEQCQNLDNE